MKRLAIIGKGDLGQQIAYHAKSCNYDVIGFFDDFASSVLGKTSDVKKVFNEGGFDELMIGIGYKHMEVRTKLFLDFEASIPFAKVIHPTAIIDPTCKVGEGSFIYPGCVLDMNAIVGKNVSLNAGCVVAHDSSIGNHTMLSPGVVVSGFVRIENNVNLGTGTKVIDNIHVSANIRTGAGAVITENLELPGLYLGIPAIFKKP